MCEFNKYLLDVDAILELGGNEKLMFGDVSTVVHNFGYGKDALTCAESVVVVRKQHLK